VFAGLRHALDDWSRWVSDHDRAAFSTAMSHAREWLEPPEGRPRAR
jgi:hypothetical protein